MFVRTESGLSNRARFTRADYTVYVEGGGGIPGAGSSDVIFWGDVLSKNKSGLRFTVKPHGGKPELEAMAEKVRSGAVTHTIVAMDADYDVLLGDLMDHPNILYTYGYSWENDAFDPDHLEEALKRILKGEDIPADALEVINSSIASLLSCLIPWINADFWLRSMRSSLFPKLSTGRYISSSAVNKSIVLRSEVLWSECRKQMKAIPGHRKRERPSVWILSGHSFLQGHVMQFLMNCVIRFSMTVLGKKNKVISEDHLEAVMIHIASSRIASCSDQKNLHYRRQLLGIT